MSMARHCRLCRRSEDTLGVDLHWNDEFCRECYVTIKLIHEENRGGKITRDGDNDYAPYIELEEPWNSRGYAKVFGVPQKGVKCIICEGLAYDSVVCSECTEAVRFMRSVDNLQQLKEFLWELPEWKQSISILKQKAMEEWVKESLHEQYDN